MGNKRANKFLGSPKKAEKPAPPELKEVRCGLCVYVRVGNHNLVNGLKAHAAMVHRKKLKFQCNRCHSPQPDAGTLATHVAACPWKA